MTLFTINPRKSSVFSASAWFIPFNEFRLSCLFFCFDFFFWLLISRAVCGSWFKCAVSSVLSSVKNGLKTLTEATVSGVPSVFSASCAFLQNQSSHWTDVITTSWMSAVFHYSAIRISWIFNGMILDNTISHVRIFRLFNICMEKKLVKQ